MPEEPQPQPSTETAPTPPEVPAAAVAPAADANTDNVWISKEEYQRLQQAEAQLKPTGVIGSLPPGSEPAPGQPDMVKYRLGVVRVILGALLALLTIYGFLSGNEIVVILGLGGIVIFAGISLQEYFSAKKNGGYVVVAKQKSTTRTLVTSVLFILLIPVLIPVLFFVLMIIMCLFGGCRGS